MPAVIDMSNNRENMAYVGDKPWHGLGVTMNDDASLDQWRIAAGMDWKAVKVPVQYQAGEQLITDPSQMAMYRNDTNALLSVVTPKYQPVQPEEVVEFYRDLIDKNGFKMETLGGLDGGKRIWALAKTGAETRILGQDAIGGYLLLATSFDGTMATRAMFTTVRVVCQNTLSMATGSDAGVKVSHRTGFDANRVKMDLGLYERNWERFNEMVDALAKTKVKKDEDALAYMMEVFAPETDAGDLSTRKTNQIKHALGLYAGNGKGSNLRSADGTMWGLVNAVTEYVDHHGGAHNDNNRLKRAWFGEGNDMKNRAFDLAMQKAA